MQTNLNAQYNDHNLFIFLTNFHTPMNIVFLKQYDSDYLFIDTITISCILRLGEITLETTSFYSWDVLLQNKYNV